MIRNIILAVIATLLLSDVAVEVLGLAPRDVPYWKTGPRSIAFHQVTPFYDVHYRMNKYGLRGADPDMTAGRVRIVDVGDSYTFGWGVPESDTIPAKIEDRLKTVLANDKIDVINFGVPGTNPFNFYSYVEKYAAQFKPDVVMVSVFKVRNTFLGGDLKSPEDVKPYLASARNRALVENVPKDEIKARNRWTWNLALGRLLARGLNGINFHYANVDWPGPEHTVLERRGWFGAHAAVIDSLPAELRPMADEMMIDPRTIRDRETDLIATFGLLAMMRDAAESYGAKFIVLILPVNWQIYQQQDPTEYEIAHSREIDRRAESLCRAEHLVCVNATDGMERFGVGKPSAEIALPDSHFTAEAATAFADIISPAVVTALRKTSP